MYKIFVVYLQIVENFFSNRKTIIYKFCKNLSKRFIYNKNNNYCNYLYQYINYLNKFKKFKICIFCKKYTYTENNCRIKKTIEKKKKELKSKN